MVTFNELKITPDGQKLIIDVSIKDLPYYKNVYLESISIDTQDTYISSGPSSLAEKYIISEYPNYPIIVVSNLDFEVVTETNYKYKNIVVPNTIYDFSNVKLDVTFEGKPIIYDFCTDLETCFDTDIKSLNGKIAILNDDKSDFNFINLLKNYKLELSVNESMLDFSKLLFVYIKTTGVPTPDTPCGMDNMTTLGVVTNLYPLYQQAFGYIKELSDTCITPKNFINFILQYKAFQLAVKTGHYTEAIKYWKKFLHGIKDVTVTSKCGCHG